MRGRKKEFRERYSRQLKTGAEKNKLQYVRFNMF